MFIGGECLTCTLEAGFRNPCCFPLLPLPQIFHDRTAVKSNPRTASSSASESTFQGLVAIHSALSAPGTATGGSQRCPSRCPQGVAPLQLLPIQSQRVLPGYHPSERCPIPRPEGLLLSEEEEEEASDA